MLVLQLGMLAGLVMLLLQLILQMTLGFMQLQLLEIMMLLELRNDPETVY